MKAVTISISAWGNSHGIRLSRELMQAMHITPATPLQVQVVAPGRLELRVKPTILSLAQKLKAYDPAIHGGEMMANDAIGAEFGAR